MLSSLQFCTKNKLVSAWQQAALLYNATAEIGAGFLVILSLIAPPRSIFLVYLYWQFLKMRFWSPDAATYHRMVSLLRPHPYISVMILASAKKFYSCIAQAVLQKFCMKPFLNIMITNSPKLERSLSTLHDFSIWSCLPLKKPIDSIIELYIHAGLDADQ